MALDGSALARLSSATAHGHRLADRGRAGDRAYLHRWETAAIKAGEVLARPARDRPAPHLLDVHAAAALVDKRQAGQVAEGSLPALAREQQRELAEVDAYYERAGRNSARIVYFRGMVWGSLALAVAIGIATLMLWAFSALHPGDARTQALFASIGMGAVGAILSVMTRMASEKSGFDLDYEVGRKSVRFLGALRPWIGALFAFALYVAMKAGLIVIAPDIDRNLYFWAAVAFLAGFSERYAKVLIGGALGAADGPQEDKNSRAAAAAAARAGGGART